MYLPKSALENEHEVSQWLSLVLIGVDMDGMDGCHAVTRVGEVDCRQYQQYF